MHGVLCPQMMCKLLYFVQSLNYICSVVILTVISLERYLAINHPMLNRRFARTRAVRGAVATAVWLTSVLYSLPHLIAYDTISVGRQASIDLDDVGGETQTTAATAVVMESDVFCLNTHPNVTSVYVLINFAALYVTPLSLMIFVYTRISVKLWRSGSESAASSSLRVSTETRRTRAAHGGSLRNPSYVRHSSPSPAAHVCELANLRSTPRSAPTPQTVRWAAGQAARNHRPPAAIEMEPVDVHAAAADDSEPQLGVVDERPRRPFRCHTDGPAVAPAFAHHNPLRSRRKVVRLLIAFVVSFAVCMLPNHVWLLWQQWADLQLYSYEQYRRHMFVPPVMTLLFYVNSCLNPFLYALISDNFRSAVSEADCFRRCRRRQRSSGDIRCVAKLDPPTPRSPPGENSL